LFCFRCVVAAFIAILAIANAQLCPVPACDLFLGSANDWSVVVSGDLLISSYTDVGGRVLVFGDANIGSTVGDKLYGIKNINDIDCADIAQDPNCQIYSLAVGGQLLWQQGQVNAGNVLIVDGSGSEFPVGPGGANLSPDCTIDTAANLSVFDSTFPDVLSDLDSFQTFACGLNATGNYTVSGEGTTLTLSGTDIPGTVEVFTIDGSVLSNARTIYLNNVNTPDAIIIQVTGGSSVSIGNVGLLGSFSQYQDKIYWVFCNATEINLYSVGLYGSVVAMDADITANSGNIFGNIYAASATLNFQVNYVPSTGCILAPTPAPTPAPVCPQFTPLSFACAPNLTVYVGCRNGTFFLPLQIEDVEILESCFGDGDGIGATGKFFTPGVAATACLQDNVNGTAAVYTCNFDNSFNITPCASGSCAAGGVCATAPQTAKNSLKDMIVEFMVSHKMIPTQNTMRGHSIGSKQHQIPQKVSDKAQKIAEKFPQRAQRFANRK